MAEDKQLVPEQGDSIMADVEEPTTAKTDVSTTENDSKGDSTDKTTTEAVVDNATEKADKSPGNSLLLPIARVKRIIKQDDEITACSTSAVYAIASATELFIKHFTEQALLRAKFEKRKKMSYNDFADAVSNVSELQFLSTLVPKTEKLSTLMAKGIVKKHKLSKGQRMMGEFSKTNGAKSKEHETLEDAQDDAEEESTKVAEVDADEDVVMKL